jgi:hypothetical protein
MGSKAALIREASEKSQRLALFAMEAKASSPSRAIPLANSPGTGLVQLSWKFGLSECRSLCRCHDTFPELNEVLF